MRERKHHRKNGIHIRKEKYFEKIQFLAAESNQQLSNCTDDTTTTTHQKYPWKEHIFSTACCRFWVSANSSLETHTWKMGMCIFSVFHESYIWINLLTLYFIPNKNCVKTSYHLGRAPSAASSSSLCQNFFAVLTFRIYRGHFIFYFTFS